MKKLVLFIVLNLLIKVGMAQSIPTFSKLILDSGNAGGGINITSIGDSIYLTFYSHDTSSSYQYLHFVKYGLTGQEMTRKKLKKPRYYISADTKSFKPLKNGTLMCAGNWGPNDSAGASGIAVNIRPQDLDTINIRTYNRGVLSDFFGFEQLSDGNYLFCGEDGDGTATGIGYAWMVKTDTNGLVLWQRTMSHDTYNEAYYTSAFPGGFYQYWHSYHHGTINDNAKSAIFVDKYDNDGNLKWRDTFGVVGNDNIAGPMTALKDGGGVVVVNRLDTASPAVGASNMPLVVYKFDSNGHIAWQRYFPQDPQTSLLYSIIETKDDLVFCGGGVSNITTSNSNGISGGVVLKLGNMGSLLFFNVLRYDSSRYDRLYDITETADGGYAAIGNAYEAVGGVNRQRAWLVKVDSNGCLNGNCPTLHTGIGDLSAEADRFLLFPNPANTQFTVAVTETSYFRSYKDLVFSLYDLTGREVMSTTLSEQASTYPVADYCPGVYLWQISEGDRRLSTGKLVVTH